jgi:hypothetical protein
LLQKSDHLSLAILARNDRGDLPIEHVELLEEDS